MEWKTKKVLKYVYFVSVVYNTVFTEISHYDNKYLWRIKLLQLQHYKYVWYT